MIKILLLLASAWMVSCRNSYRSNILYPIVYSKEPINHNELSFYQGFKTCLNNRASLHSFLKRNYRGAKCALPSDEEFTFDEMRVSYDLLERFRRSVYSGSEKRGNPGPQPRAIEGYRPLEYDNDLAFDAFRSARECLPGRDPCTLEHGVGQTVITLKSVWKKRQSNLKISNFWKMWFNEVQHFDRKLVKKFDPNEETFEKIKNYSQLIWNGTERFGCSKHIEFNGTMVAVTLVCNFWPAGNIIGEPVYITEEN